MSFKTANYVGCKFNSIIGGIKKTILKFVDNRPPYFLNNLLMKRMCRLFVVTSVLLLLFNVHPLFCNAQGGPGGDDFAGDPDAPIDGGVSLLIAAGVGYGLKKANDKRKKATAVNLKEENK